MSDCSLDDCRLACSILVDARGWLLLQERDEWAPVDDDLWGLVGGHCHPGESYEAAVISDTLEETGIDVVSDPRVTCWQRWWAGELTVAAKSTPDLTDTWEVWIGRADLVDADVVCREGRQIVFVDPDQTFEIPLGRGPARLLPLLLAPRPTNHGGRHDATLAVVAASWRHGRVRAT